MTACYEIAKRTYDFVMTYVGYRTINMTLVMLFLVGNKWLYGIGHVVKNHLDSKRKPALLFPNYELAAMGLLYAPPHRQDSSTLMTQLC